LTKILLLSDTHGFIDNYVLKHAALADEIWHAGDIGTTDVTDILSKIKPLRAVYGNIDGEKLRVIFKEKEIFKCEDVVVYLTHIGGYPGAYAKGIKEDLISAMPMLFICGHSHILKVVRDKSLNNMLHLNPGAAGKSGFHTVRTMLTFTIDGKSIGDMNVIEMEK
jgi:uncharacterized protein